MTGLFKRAGIVAASDVDSYDLPTVVRQADVVLETGDVEIAKLLATRIVRATRSGEWRFDDAKLGKLVVLAGALTNAALNEGMDREALRKAANGLREPAGADLGPLPPDYRARAERAISAYDNAVSEIEKAAAEAGLRSLYGDLVSRNAIATCLAGERRTIGVAPR